MIEIDSCTSREDGTGEEGLALVRIDGGVVKLLLARMDSGDIEIALPPEAVGRLARGLQTALEEVCRD